MGLDAAKDCDKLDDQNAEVDCCWVWHQTWAVDEEHSNLLEGGIHRSGVQFECLGLPLPAGRRW